MWVPPTQMPLSLFIIVRRYIKLRGDTQRWETMRWWRLRAALLLTGYKPHFWYMESVDLIRKVLSTSGWSRWPLMASDRWPLMASDGL